jgi:hypothetical protein
MPVTSTQQFIPIAQIKQGILILKDGGLRAILEISPVNFALKSQQDQDVLIGQFQNFLNSLEFPLQMVVQSRRLDIFPYLKGLIDYAQNISSDLLRIHAFDYIDFVQRLTGLANIMEKKFFCVVPYEAQPLENPSMLKKLFSSRLKISVTQSQFERYKEKLEQRVQIISGGLKSMGLQVKRLNTQAIIEEFYYIFNPEEAHEERLQNLAQIRAPIIKAKPKKTSLPRIDKTEEAGPSQPIKSNELRKPVNNSAYKLNPKVQRSEIRDQKSDTNAQKPETRHQRSEFSIPTSEIKQDAQKILKNLK